MKNILKSVYRCDSAAVVDGDSSCGSVGNQALYQGVEVILRRTTCNYGNDIGDNLKSAVASKPFIEYKCFCDDDDFLAEESYPARLSSTKNFQVCRGSSFTSSTGSGESRNERNPWGSLMEYTEDDQDDDDDVRNAAEGVHQTDSIFASPNTPPNRHTQLTTHTRNFYSKINSPASRTTTKLYDVPTPSYTKPTLDKVRSRIPSMPTRQVLRFSS
mmetsp:Transcript_2190/g.4611  ORF Transcript_2190/g.4611 Transcript_2190/m.4611 type:complete len:215 (+) Transcript_2190:2-646(+)